jgi:hypothetical protein
MTSTSADDAVGLSTTFIGYSLYRGEAVFVAVRIIVTLSFRLSPVSTSYGLYIWINPLHCIWGIIAVISILITISTLLDYLEYVVSHCGIIFLTYCFSLNSVRDYRTYMLACVIVELPYMMTLTI